MMAAVFSMQGIGQLMAAVVALVVTYAYKSTFEKVTNVSQCGLSCQTAADQCWRIIVGVGAVPACFALYYRLTIPETPRYTFEVAKDVEKASSDIKSYVTDSPEGEVDEMMKKLGPTLDLPQASWQDLRSYFGRWGNFKVLLGTTLAWFFLVSGTLSRCVHEPLC